MQKMRKRKKKKERRRACELHVRNLKSAHAKRNKVYGRKTLPEDTAKQPRVFVKTS